MKPEQLVWDSNFFNCKVGRLIIKQGELISDDILTDFDLVYLIIENEISPAQKKYFQDKAFFADEKLTYQKKIKTLINCGNNIFSWPVDKEINDELRQIGMASGEFSRFKIDPSIPKEKFVELYTTWIINSATRTIAEELYFFEEDNQIAGLITLCIKNNKANIGILSVHEKFRGKHIASQLVNAAEYWTKNLKGFDLIQVVTQAANSAACRFYEKCGFTIQKREYVFHWWKKNQEL